MIHSSISHAANAVTASLSPTSEPALQETDHAERHNPAAWVALSAEARGRSHAPPEEVTRDAAERVEESKSSDPRMKQVLWSKSLWKTNPSGVSETYKPPKPSRPAPLRSTATLTPSDRNVVPLRDGHTDQEARSARANRHRARLQAYSAVERGISDSMAASTEAELTAREAHSEAEEGAQRSDGEVTASHLGRGAPGVSRYVRS